MPLADTPNISRLQERFHALNQETSHEAASAAAQGQRVTLRTLVITPFITFLQTYWQKKAWRQGTPGLITALFAAYAVFVRAAKLWERQHVTTPLIPPPPPSSHD